MTVALNAQFYEDLKVLITGVFVLNVLDGICTIFLVGSGFALEGNPLMANLIAHHPVLFMLCKVILVLLGSAILWRFRTNRMAVVSIFATFIVYYTTLLYQVQCVRPGLVYHLLS
jgi:hypothetical protein